MSVLMCKNQLMCTGEINQYNIQKTLFEFCELPEIKSLTAL